MNEEILKVLSMVKNGVMDEADAEELLSAMYENAPEQEEKQTTVIRNYLPWDDDGKLRIIAFKGHKKIDDAEAYSKFKFRIALDGDVLDVAGCCGDLECANVRGNATAGGGLTSKGDIGGNASAGGGLSCSGKITGGAKSGGGLSCGGSIDGSVTAGGALSCGGDIKGNVSCGGAANCGNVTGDVSAGTKVTCGNVGGSVRADSVECKGTSGNVDFSGVKVGSEQLKKDIGAGMDVAAAAMASIGSIFDGIDFSKIGTDIGEKVKQAQEKVNAAQKDINEKAAQEPIIVADGEKVSYGETTVLPSVPWEDNGDIHIAAFVGKTLIKDEKACRDYNFNVTLDNDVEGNVTCCGNLTCGEIGGNVNAGGTVACDGDINGDVNVGGTVTCDGDINGDVNVGGTVNCDGDINGDASAGGDIKCDGDIGGDASAGGDINCGGEISGDASAGGDINCGGEISGDATADNGSITCGKIGGDANAKIINKN